VVSIQGCGHVGYHLARELHEAGAALIVSDIDTDKARAVAASFGAQAVGPDQIYSVEADIFAPSAMGGIINDDTIPQLKVQVIAGAANNQLLETRHGDELEQRGIVYAPDYVANAGGVINVYGELAGWDKRRALRKASEIYNTLISIFQTARAENIPTYAAADRVAERRLRSVGSLTKTTHSSPRPRSL
jgi:leucine dehydrogenase